MWRAAIIGLGTAIAVAAIFAVSLTLRGGPAGIQAEDPPPPGSQNPTFSLSASSTSGYDPSDLLRLSPGAVPPPVVAYTCAALGLAGCGGTDDVDAVSLGRDWTLPPPDPDHPHAALFFSVAPGSSGLSGTAVREEANCSTAEPEADEFGSAVNGTNYQYFDGNGTACGANSAPSLGLAEPGDDLDALDAFNPATDGEPIFFSTDGPSWGSGWGSGADIMVRHGGTTTVFASAPAIGLDSHGGGSDNVDALCVRDTNGDFVYQPGTDIIWYSLSADSASLADAGVMSAADIFAAPYWATPVITAAQLGLQPTDDLDALKCYGNEDHLQAFSLSASSTSGYDPSDLLTLSPGKVPPPTVAYPCDSFGLAGCGGADDVDAVSLGRDWTLPPPDPTHPNATFFFSVAPGSTGQSGTAVRAEANCSSAEPEADEFGSQATGNNYQYFDGNGTACGTNSGAALGLVEPGDDLDALDPFNPATEGEPIFFSTAGPSSASGSGADILVRSGGTTDFYIMAPSIGLDQAGGNTDNIDALCVWDDGNGVAEPGVDTIWYSLEEGSDSLTRYGNSAADIFAAGNPVFPVITAEQLGLQPTDDLDALKCYRQEMDGFRLSRYTIKGDPSPLYACGLQETQSGNSGTATIDCTHATGGNLTATVNRATNPRGYAGWINFPPGGGAVWLSGTFSDDGLTLNGSWVSADPPAAGEFHSYYIAPSTPECGLIPVGPAPDYKKPPTQITLTSSNGDELIVEAGSMTGTQPTQICAQVINLPIGVGVGSNIIARAYHLTPEGTTFNPPATGVYHYQDYEIVPGMDENRLKVAVYDSTKDRWVALQGTVDAVANTVTIHPIDHFSMVQPGMDCGDGPDTDAAFPEPDGMLDLCDLDDDEDGCRDQKELGPDKMLGGERNPLNHYDFYDITNITQVVGSKDKAVSGFDLNVLLGYLNSFAGDGGLYDGDTNDNDTPDGEEMDFAGLNSLWPNSGPDGAISGFDLNDLLMQLNDSCPASP
jgi:hypothetical protein